MAVENGYGAELEMVVDEENHDTAVVNEKEENGKNHKDKKIDDDGATSTGKDGENGTAIDEVTTVVMEVDEVHDTDPLADNEDEDRVVIASIEKTAGDKKKSLPLAESEPKATECVKNQSRPAADSDVNASDSEKTRAGKRDRDQTSGNVTSTGDAPVNVKIKEEPASEIVLIDSEEEKDEKPKVKVTPRSMQLRQHAKPANNYGNYGNGSHNKKSGDFQIVSVDDDSPMNKNDPMNVFLCSTEEREFRKDYFKDPSSNVLKQRLHCTICDIHIGACPQNSKNMVCHRFLKVLICRKCANFYGQGEFPQEEGSDEFCRWCGEGGEVFLCNTCSNVFCQACILRNFGMQEIKRVDRLENWDCYVCDPRPLWTLRAIAFALFTYVRRIKVVAYRNGMYQSVNSASTKVSKSDLMALETDLSTCCPKEVKAAAAAASAPPAESNRTSSSLQPSPTGNVLSKGKEANVTSQIAGVRTSSVVSKGLFPSTPAYNSPRSSASKRPTKSGKPSGTSPQGWSQEQMLSKYLPGPGRKVPVQQPFTPVGYPHQSTLRSALVGQQPNFTPNSFGGQNVVVYPEANSDSQSETGVLNWFNGILSSLMDTIKNIENRLVFIRNSTSNLISQNEVSFLVNQLHNLLKVSSSKMQEVDCDLLKNYKEFIDKSEITVNDFDDIVREYPEFFKASENNEEPESTGEDPEPPDDFNPMALVEVIEEGDQVQPSSSGDALKKHSDGESAKRSFESSSKKNNNGRSSTGAPFSVTIKKEVITCDDEDEESSETPCGRRKSKETGSSNAKRKTDVKDNRNGVKKIRYETVKIKEETIADDCDDEESEAMRFRRSQHMKKCLMKVTDSTINAEDEEDS